MKTSEQITKKLDEYKLAYEKNKKELEELSKKEFMGKGEKMDVCRKAMSRLRIAMDNLNWVLISE